MSEGTSPKQILVTYADNPAKLLLALPVFQALRTAYPGAKITAFVTAGVEGMIGGLPSIDRVESFSKKESLFRLEGRFRAMGADACLHLSPSPRMVLAAWLAKIPLRIGSDYKWHALFLTRAEKINRAVSDRNEVEYNLDLLKSLEIQKLPSKIDFPIPEEAKNRVRERLQQKGLASTTPYVLVHPGSKGGARHWKTERFGQLIGHLCQIKGLRVVITAEADETTLVAEVTAFLYSLPLEQKPVVVVTGDLTLKELGALCQGALCVLTGPTGPLYLAAAVGAPTVAIFSPAPEATPDRWGPWGNENTVLIPKGSQCPACQVGYCKKHDPMDVLTVPEVFEAMKSYIRKAVTVD